MTFSHREVDSDADVELLYSWLTEPRAEFWGMTDHTREQIAETYQLIDSLSSHHAYLLLDQQRPVALFQTYQPEHDPMGECYDWQPGDLGAHLFMGPTDAPQSGFSELVLIYLCDLAFGDPEVQRLIAEPDQRNTKSVALVSRYIASEGQVDLGHKQAELFTVTRDQFFELKSLWEQGAVGVHQKLNAEVRETKTLADMRTER